MSVVVVSVEQHQAPLDLLERVAVTEEQLGKTLRRLADQPNLVEVVVLSTCLRTELYAVVERFHDGVDDLQGFLAGLAETDPATLADHVTVLFDDAVAVHLFEVAAGLRSAVVGETEVLGQVRRAAERARAEQVSGPVLDGLFARAVQTGRRVRTTTAIARGATSLSHVAVALAAEQFDGELADRRALVVGAGEMGAGVAEALGARGCRVTVANRSRGRAEALAERVGGEAVGLSGLGDALAGADVVVATTGSALPVLDAGSVAAATDGGRRLVVVDLGVPRNVEGPVGALPGVELFDMDDLRAHAARALDGRRAELARAEEIVHREVERYRADVRARGAAPIVSALRSRLEQVLDAELQRHRPRSGLDDEQWAEVQAVSRDVLAKLLHAPSLALKHTAGTPRGERLVEALRTLFDL